MKLQPHDTYYDLEEMPDLVTQQRRLNATKRRAEDELKAVHAKLDALLENAKVDAVSCEVKSGTFEVRRAVSSRDGHRYASVTPLRA